MANKLDNTLKYRRTRSKNARKPDLIWISLIVCRAFELFTKDLLKSNLFLRALFESVALSSRFSVKISVGLNLKLSF